MLRLIGLATWLVASVPTFLDVLHRPRQTAATPLVVWLVAFLAFGISFWFTSFAASDFRNSYRQALKLYLPLIAVQSAATLVMVYLIPCYSIGILLVIVAWQVALLPLWATLLWIFVQTAFLATILYEGSLSSLALFATNTSLGFQLFAFVTASIAKSEARGRDALARANAELRAAQELLEESCRLSERARISGELHDVLGHNLTALNIHLEVARHVAGGKALEHVQKSQVLAKVLLRDVREVVSAVRGNDQIDVRRAVEALVGGLPHPQIHLTLAGDLRVEDSASAHTLLRCIQEITTNTLRHSGAENLWIEVYQAEGGVEMRARDDGRGAKAVKAGSGLTGMRQRLEKMGGRLRVDTKPAEGFAVNAWLPLRKALS